MRAHLLVLLASAAVLAPAALAGQRLPQAWVTSADRSELLAPVTLEDASAAVFPTTISVDPTRRFQPVIGFGFALTGASAELLQRMSPAARTRLLRELFAPGPAGVGVSWLRISIGSSDLDREAFTYDDRPAGEADPTLAHFSLAPDQRWLAPTLREILAINPELPILASPWSPPSWMKTNDSRKGGALRPEMSDAFARYLLAYVEGMAALGVPIWGVTLQNEPEDATNTPSMLMSAPEQEALIAGYVGPALRAAGLATKIIAYDHNCNHPEYALAVEGSRAAAPFVAGAAFHLYRGSADAMALVHSQHPDKPVWLTEQMVIDDVTTGRPTPVARPLSRVVIGSLNAWAQGVLLWNLAADPNYGPHLNDGGCPVCEGALTLNGDHVTRNVAYAVIAQVARFVPRGSERVGSTQGGDVPPNVAFRTPDGALVLVVANPGLVPVAMRLTADAATTSYTLPAGAAITLRWP